MFPKIIIECGAGVSHSLALEAVVKVIDLGRISESRNIAHYCWVSYPPGDIPVCVIVRKKDTVHSADSFVVQLKAE